MAITGRLIDHNRQFIAHNRVVGDQQNRARCVSQSSGIFAWTKCSRLMRGGSVPSTIASLDVWREECKVQDAPVIGRGGCCIKNRLAACIFGDHGMRAPQGGYQRGIGHSYFAARVDRLPTAPQRKRDVNGKAERRTFAWYKTHRIWLRKPTRQSIGCEAR